MSEIKTPRNPRDNLPPGPGPGRPKGLQNKLTRDVKAMFEPYGELAKNRLIGFLMQKKDPYLALAAAREILDRGFGKPHQTIISPLTGGINVQLISLTGKLPDAKAIDVEPLRITNGKGNGHTPAE